MQIIQSINTLTNIMRDIGTASARHADVKHTRANSKTTLSSDYIDSLMKGTGCLDFLWNQRTTQRNERGDSRHWEN